MFNIKFGGVDLAVSLSIGMIGLRTLYQIMHPKNLTIMKTHAMKLLFLVAIVHILFTSADVGAQEAKISVTKTADPTFGSPSTNVTFTLEVTNSGSAALPHVFVSDLLPVGMTYVSSSSGSTNVGQNVNWSDIGPMSSGGNKSLQIVAHIDGPVIGKETLTNNVDVSGKPENGQNVTPMPSPMSRLRKPRYQSQSPGSETWHGTW